MTDDLEAAVAKHYAVSDLESRLLAALKTADHDVEHLDHGPGTG